MLKILIFQTLKLRKFLCIAQLHTFYLATAKLRSLLPFTTLRAVFSGGTSLLLSTTSLFFFIFTVLCVSTHIYIDFTHATEESSVNTANNLSLQQSDYLSNHAVPLTSKEIKALQLSEKWIKTDIPPVLSSGGKIIYLHGAVLPSIIDSPMQVCDVELQLGERVKEIVVGDSARWLIESGSSGSGSTETVHLFIKPVDTGLESTAIVTTDRRTYHLRLISRRDRHTPYISFQYADQMRQAQQVKQAAQEHKELWNTTNVVGNSVDLAQLYFVTNRSCTSPRRC